MAQMRRVRTIFYGDQPLTPSEIELLHTPALQRLYDLHQLGLTDRVFIDASHSRLHHVIGVIHHADKLMAAIAKNLGEEVRRGIRTGLEIGPPDRREPEEIANLVGYVKDRRNVARLMGLLHDLTHAPYGHTLEDEIQLAATKHDEPDRQAEAFYRLLCQLVAWLAIENGVDLSECPELERHVHAPDLCVLAPVDECIKATTAVLNSSMAAHRMAHDFGPATFAQLLRDLYLAMQSLLRLELLHKSPEKLRQNPRLLPQVKPYDFQILIRKSLHIVGEAPATEFNPHKDAFLIDLIGNTVCADLLDYAQRDAHFTNIKTTYDPDRIVESFTLVEFESLHRDVGSEKGRISEDPFFGYILRPAIALFTHKLRTDIPSGILDLLHSRYNLHERALFHSTKCVAGAMLGRALELIGLRPLPVQMLFVGDQVFLHEALQAARLASYVLREEESKKNKQRSLLETAALHNIQEHLEALPPARISQIARLLIENHTKRSDKRGGTIQDMTRNLDGGIFLLEALMARRFHRTIFRILPNRKNAEHTYDAADKDKNHTHIIAECFCDPDSRLEVEMAIENAESLPRGSVVIHCPPYGGAAKVAEVLLLSRQTEGKESHETFREAHGLQDAMFTDHVRAVDALEKMYWSTWRLTVSVAAPHFLKWEPLCQAISKEMENLLKAKRRFTEIKLENDPAMVAELKMAAARTSQDEELMGVQQGASRKHRRARTGAQYVPIGRGDLEPIIFPYGIVPRDRLEVRQKVIPEFITNATALVGDHPERWPLLATRVLTRRLPNSAYYNRVTAETLRSALTALLTKFEEDLKSGQ